MTINGSFRFHPVGQGLFYSGILNSSKSPFSFVYDCGTESNRDFLRREIDDFKRLLPKSRSSGKKSLNLLVLSHFHDDHVNGLEYLLQDVDIDTVVIPYMEEDQVLLARLESKKTEEFLDDFYLDAKGWLASHGVRRILVTGAERSEAIYRSNGRNILDQSNNNWDNNAYNNLEYDDFPLPEENILFRDEVDNTTVVYLGKETTIKSEVQCWEFSFGNIMIPKMKQYKDTIEDFMKSYLVTISDILKSKDLTNKLKRRLRQVLSNGRSTNQTSVIFKHRPLFRCTKYKGVIYISCSDIKRRIEEFGWCVSLLTGDIESLTDDIERAEYFDKQPLDVERHSLLVLQVPHHGASGAEKLPVDKEKNQYSIVSYGISNKYGHPSREVFHRYRNIVLVNEREGFDYYLFS